MRIISIERVSSGKAFVLSATVTVQAYRQYWCMYGQYGDTRSFYFYWVYNQFLEFFYAKQYIAKAYPVWISKYGIEKMAQSRLGFPLKSYLYLKASA